jgi:hypothetical protein
MRRQSAQNCILMSATESRSHLLFQPPMPNRHSLLLCHRHLFFLCPYPSNVNRVIHLPPSRHEAALRLEPVAHSGEEITSMTGSLVWIAPQKLRS